MTELTFELLKVGQCRQVERLACRTGAWRIGVFPALAALIRHPLHGLILFDTGYAARIFDVTRHWPEKLYALATPVELAPEEELGAQLKRRGLALGDVRMLVISHFHADHIAGVRDLPHARFLCSREGLASIRTTTRFKGVRRGLLPALLPDDFEARAAFIEDCPLVALPAVLAPFSTGYDLFSDRSLIAVPLLGHAPGQYGVVLRVEGGGFVFLVADAAWSTAALREDALPMAIAGHLVGHSAAYPTTFHRLHELSRRTSDAEVLIVPSHCPVRARELAR